MVVPKSTYNKHLDKNSINFSMYSASDIRKLSVLRIFSPLTFNTLGHPLPGGLYDPALGPFSERASNCTTCYNNFDVCPGHLGHIELPLPVVNPLYYRIIFQILRMSCLTCHKIILNPVAKYLFITQLKLLNLGYLIEAQETQQFICSILQSQEESIDKSTLESLLSLKMSDYITEVLQKNPKNEHINSKNLQALKNEAFNTILKQNKQKFCFFCKGLIRKISTLENKIFTEIKDGISKDKKNNMKSSNNVMLMPEEQRDHLNLLWENEKEFILTLVPMLKNSNEDHPCDLLFLNVIPVPPPRVRPVQILNGRISDHAQTHNYKLLLESTIVTSNLLKAIQEGSVENLTSTGQEVISSVYGNTLHEKLHNSWLKLQTCVDLLLDIDLHKRIKLPGNGLKQMIEKKEGCIRMHMMGKRVNFAARSVITPDPNLAIGEIGIPEIFALKLTYPVPVTEWNVSELRKMIINGPLKHPGAVMIENENGNIIKIHPTDINLRTSLAKCLLTPGEDRSLKGIKIVHRHLLNGDILLMNRQPTLHRPSIMAHTARIIKNEKTLRMHYANCKAYNADFDGDEMNAHFPQNELARSEAYNLVNVNSQYVVPKDGTPLSGLIQDHVIGGVKLSMRGQFFTKEEYHQLVFQGLATFKGHIKLLPPTILKPELLWSGKQVISTLIINVIPKGKTMINLTSTAKINSNAWISNEPRPWKVGGTPFKNGNDMCESQVIIKQGELLCGVLEKNHYGATPYGLIHCLYELYGGITSSRLLSAFSKTFMFFLQSEGFSLGVEDILVLKTGDKQRKKLIKEVEQIGDVASLKALNEKTLSRQELYFKLKEAFFAHNPKWRGKLDTAYKSYLDDFTNKINKVCLPNGLISKFPKNNLQLMVHSGAKGSTVNTMQISCLLGQIELEGKRPPLMISGKALPCFPAFDTSAKAGGFIASRFMTGIKPHEFFFHCMAGREGLIDTAVKTSRSGYLQRCLIKHLEGLSVHYDQTVRDSDGSIIQFQFGEDGQEVTKTQFLNIKQLPFLLENFNAITEGFEDETLNDNIKEDMKIINKWKKRQQSINLDAKRFSPFSNFSLQVRDKIKTSKWNKLSKKTGRPIAVKKVEQMWRDLNEEERQTYIESAKPCPPPLTSKYRSDRDYGVITEYLDKLIATYTKENNVNKNKLKQLCYVKSIKSQCHAGEPVGVLAAQSIGEPSTQMTLNTFHFAGRGEMNVTLGIPRLREILMLASKSIKTPSMEIPFLPSLKNLEKKADNLRRELNQVCIQDVLENVVINHHYQFIPKRAQIYKLRFNFLPKKAYKKDFNITPSEIITRFETKFLKNFIIYILKKLKRKVDLVIFDKENSTKQSDEQLDNDEDVPQERDKQEAFGEEHESSDEDPEGEDDDATLARSRKKHKDNQEYEDPEEEEKEEEDQSSDNEFDKENSDDDNDLSENEDYLLPKEVLEKYQEHCLNISNKHHLINDYAFDNKKYRWCEITLEFTIDTINIDIVTTVKEVVKQSIIKEVPGIRKSFLYKNNDTGALMLKTDGINILQMFKYHKLLDINKLYTNDISHVAETYGIEAAQRVIVKEVQMVFNVYGIRVDPRHLLLIADYMTFDGSFKSMNRHGMEINTSPLHQMSFESSLNFLRTAALTSKVDDFNSPSSRIMVGKLCKSGTGAFTLLHKLNAQ